MAQEPTWLQTPAERRGAADDRQLQRRPVEIDRQLRAGGRPEREVAIAREDHQADALAGRDDLIVGLQIERQRVELARHERLAARLRVVVAAVRERRVILRIGPAARDQVRRD